MTGPEYPPDRKYDLDALCSLDSGRRDPVILQLAEDVTPRLKNKIKSILGNAATHHVIEDLMQEMWLRLVPKLAGRRPLKYGLVAFIITMQANIAQEHRRSASLPRTRVEPEESQVGNEATPSRVYGEKQVRHAAAKALDQFRRDLETAAKSPPPPVKMERPALQLLALDALLAESGHSQALFLERGFTEQEASRLRRKALDRLEDSTGHIRHELGIEPSKGRQAPVFDRSVLERGSILADAWDLLGIGCHRHEPAPFASADPGHSTDVQWLREVHSLRCETCATRERGTAADGERAIAIVTRSLGL